MMNPVCLGAKPVRQSNCMIASHGLVRIPWNLALHFVFWLLLISLLLFQSAFGAISFSEATETAGFSYVGQSYGASWGDFNGDNMPDLWVNNHVLAPNLFLNKGDGTFDDILSTNWIGDPANDTHGGSWADFDNDGDQDLLSLAGAQSGQGQGPNQLFVNESVILTDRAGEFGIQYPESRGRTGTWVDLDNDGLLDAVLSSNKRPDSTSPSALFQQSESGFHDISSSSIVTASFIDSILPDFSFIK